MYVRRAYVWGRFKVPKSKASKAPLPCIVSSRDFFWHGATRRRLARNPTLCSRASGSRARSRCPCPSWCRSISDLSGQSRGHQGRGELAVRLSQLPACAGDGTDQIASRCEDGAENIASRRLRDDHATLRTVRYGVDARGTGQIPGAAIRQQDSPAHGNGSVRKSWVDLRIVGWNVGWKICLSATKFFEMWWPGTELNRRRQPFQG